MVKMTYDKGASMIKIWIINDQTWDSTRYRLNAPHPVNAWYGIWVSDEDFSSSSKAFIIPEIFLNFLSIF